MFTLQNTFTSTMLHQFYNLPGTNGSLETIGKKLL